MEERVLLVINRRGADGATAREVSQAIRHLDCAGARSVLDGLVTAGVLDKRKSGKTHRYVFPTSE